METYAVCSTGLWHPAHGPWAPPLWCVQPDFQLLKSAPLSLWAAAYCGSLLCCQNSRQQMQTNGAPGSHPMERLMGLDLISSAQVDSTRWLPTGAAAGATAVTS